MDFWELLWKDNLYWTALKLSKFAHGNLVLVTPPPAVIFKPKNVLVSNSIYRWTNLRSEWRVGISYHHVLQSQVPPSPNNIIATSSNQFSCLQGRSSWYLQGAEFGWRASSCWPLQKTHYRRKQTIKLPCSHFLGCSHIQWSYCKRCASNASNSQKAERDHLLHVWPVLAHKPNGNGICRSLCLFTGLCLF